MKIFKIVLLISWMLIIFLFSNDNGIKSDSKTSDVVNPTVDIIVKIGHLDLTEEQYTRLVGMSTYIIRKLAHVMEYLILSLLVINVLNIFMPYGKPLIICSLLFCLIYACSDEIHQLFIQDRLGDLIDVGIDFIGSLIGILSFCLVHKIRNRKHS